MRRNRIIKKINNIILFAFCLMIMTSCARPDGDENHSHLQSEQNTGVHYSVTECSLQNPTDLLPLSKGEFCEGYSSFLSGDKVVCISYGNNETYENLWSYIQIYDNKNGEWNYFDIKNNSFEKEGIHYEGFVKAYPSTGGVIYTRVFTENGESYLAELTANGIESVKAAFPKEDGENLKFLDREGKLYTYSQKEKKINCYDSAMQLEKVMPVPNQVYGIMQAAEGEVYWYGTGVDKKPMIGNITAGTVLIDSVQDIGSDYVAGILQDGTVYLADSQNLWRYREGKFEKIYAFGKNDYIISRVLGMECKEDGEIVILADIDSELMLLSLQESMSSFQKQELVLADWQHDPSLTKLITRFNRQNEKYHITYSYPQEGEDWKDFQRDIQLALSTGKGPDLLTDGLIPDVDTCVEKGYLVNMDDVITDSTAFVSGILENGKKDGKLYGIPYSCSFSLTAYNKKNVGERQSITLEEFVVLTEDSNAGIIEKNISGLDIIVNYVLYDGSNPTYIDWEKGKSYLAEPEFIKILEFAKKYGDSGNAEKTAFSCGKNYFSDIHEIKDIYAYFEGDAVLLGYPCENGNGIYVMSDNIYVNASTQTKEGAKEFLQFITSEIEQERYTLYGFNEMEKDGFTGGCNISFPVLKKAFDIKIKRALEEDYANRLLEIEIPYTDEMMEQIYFIINHSKPNNNSVYQIYDILVEELEPFFNGSISAEHAAKNLQNRVQLYLNER